ncbi:MAG: calcium-binding protein [Xenococcus sp. (in: cyanobacteria)]
MSNNFSTFRVHVIRGTNQDDRIRGIECKNNSIFGLAGDDTLTGRSGNDLLYGGDGRDLLVGDRGNDQLFGNQGNDTLIGADDSRDDSLAGDGEIDRLTGNQGRDRFVLGDRQEVFYNDDNPNSSGVQDYALITDFQTNVDTIQLKGSAMSVRQIFFLIKFPKLNNEVIGFSLNPQRCAFPC